MRDQFTAASVELTIRLGVLALFLYFSFFLVCPFIRHRDLERSADGRTLSGVRLDGSPAWGMAPAGGSPAYACQPSGCDRTGGVARVGPDRQFRFVSERFELSALALPPPHETVKSWPLIGDQIYEFWDLASNNLQAALAKIAPYLKPIGSSLLTIATDAGTGAIKFFIAIIIAGFLYPPAPSLVDALRRVLRQACLRAR